MALDGATQRLVTLGHGVVVHGPRTSSVPRRRCVACPAPAPRWQVISLASNKPVLSRIRRTPPDHGDCVQACWRRRVPMIAAAASADKQHELPAHVTFFADAVRLR